MKAFRSTSAPALREPKRSRAWPPAADLAPKRPPEPSGEAGGGFWPLRRSSANAATRPQRLGGPAECAEHLICHHARSDGIRRPPLAVRACLKSLSLAPAWPKSPLLVLLGHSWADPGVFFLASGFFCSMPKRDLRGRFGVPFGLPKRRFGNELLYLACFRFS